MTNYFSNKINSLLKIKFTINPFFWLVIFGSLITGQFIEIITLFAVVIIHELGHLFAAKSYGWRIIEVQLLPFGGMARMEQKSESILEEFVVAMAGPLQNFLMIFIAEAFHEFNLWSDEWATFFIEANLLIGIFNLLPISPLDGNRIMRSILYTLMPYRRAILISIFISIMITALFLIWSSGLLFNFKLNINGLILAVFFIFNNFMDIKQFPYNHWQFLLHKLNLDPKRNVAAVSIIIQQDTKIIKALHLLRKNRYHLFYVLSNDGELLKVIPEEKIINRIINKEDIYKPLSNIIS